ncbi:hypothetical protein ThrDRAFT_01157 [Frankia casuarinae]|nr:MULTISPECIES: hypothetical protein [Frankia]ETA03410.1 hypothetical protein CcI6DRAFT_01126 [Frankia sp. CcI6]EYT93187.1 hypothetical protein ThrDRAFT_01157 [Frankia casuarinae]KDA42694.1 hypothetical protein BMG523Draft_02394 [Frankia sp. BMG5.23]OAA26698.1 hypothetical protein AAY23_10284 [Frankia casuarinae]OHV56256.1 hypothetical protein CgIS1_09055 [Frankia sp. CgIS1]
MADDALMATLGELADASERARSIEAEIRTLAARAAAEGASYGDIGRALGITRQGARKRFPRLVATPPVATTSVVATAAPAGSRPPEDLIGGPPASTPEATTVVVAPGAAADSVAPAKRPTGKPERTPAPSAPRTGSTTTVVERAGASTADRTGGPEDAAGRPATSRRQKAADQPRARAGSLPSAMDAAVAAVAAMTEDTGYTLVRIETGYRVLVDGVESGTLRPDYTGTTRNRPRGWLPKAPGLVSVFPPGRSYRTRDEAVTHLLADLRHQGEQRRGRQRKPRL